MTQKDLEAGFLGGCSAPAADSDESGKSWVTKLFWTQATKVRCDSRAESVGVIDGTK